MNFQQLLGVMSPQGALKKMEDSLSEKGMKPADALHEGKTSVPDGHWT